MHKSVSEPDTTRMMFYCHDTYGLGHLRRTLALAGHFHDQSPNLSQLIVTGSPSANRFSYPDRTDYIKLPSVTKDENGAYLPRSLASNIHDIVTMRRELLLAAARNYQPDIFLVDHAPAGLRGEVVDTLRYLKAELPNTRLIVGLRDIMDEAPVVRRAWSADGSYHLFDEIYDLILVYGNRRFYDVVEEYGLSQVAAEKTRFVGYLGRKPGSRSRESVRAELGMQTDTLVVVTAGGGGDGGRIFEAMARDLHAEQVDDFDTLIVGGPLLSDQEQLGLRSQLAEQGNVHFLDFTDDLPSYLGAADAVVSMGGYNSICEILSLRKQAIVIPRTTPRQEQLIRANVLSRQGFIDMLHPADLAPGRLLRQVYRSLSSVGSARPVLSMNGLSNAYREISGLSTPSFPTRVPSTCSGRGFERASTHHTAVLAGR